MRILAKLRGLPGWGALGPYWEAMASKGTGWYRFARWCVRRILMPLLGGVRVRHPERVPDEGALILASSHFSVMDPPVISTAIFRRPITYLAKEELFKTPLVGKFFYWIGAIPLRRGAVETDAIRLALDSLKREEAILLFPEGTRGNGETLGAMRSGVYMLAKKTGAPVLPMGISGTHIIMPKGQKVPKRRRVTIAIGHPFTVKEAAALHPERDAKAAFNHELELRIQALCHEAGLPIKIAPAATHPEGSDPSESATEAVHSGPEQPQPQP